MQHRPRKRFGQNFLQDQQIIQRIIASCHFQASDRVIEIGPGMGALTRLLLTQLDHLTVIEIDHDLQHYLQTHLVNQEKLCLIGADALTVDYSQFGLDLRVIGNLPYNISTPLLFHLLNFRTCIQDMTFMLQKEVVLRMAASPGNKQYGRLSVMFQYYCEVLPLFEVPPTAFYPAPQVDSAIVRLRPYSHPPFEPVDPLILEKLLATAFSMRRKTLANNLKKIISADELSQLGLDPTDRPETISIENYVKMANYLASKDNVI